MSPHQPRVRFDTYQVSIAGLSACQAQEDGRSGLPGVQGTFLPGGEEAVKVVWVYGLQAAVELQPPRP